MSQIRRVVVDTSTLVSAALRVGSKPYQALMQVFACCELCASETALAELETVLNREKFARYLDLESRRAFISLIRRHAVIFHVGHGEIASVSPPCRDQKDSQFLALALAAEAEVLISSDGDLLVLHPWNGIAVLTPAQFDSRR